MQIATTVHSYSYSGHSVCGHTSPDLHDRCWPRMDPDWLWSALLVTAVIMEQVGQPTTQPVSNCLTSWLFPFTSGHPDPSLTMHWHARGRFNYSWPMQSWDGVSSERSLQCMVKTCTASTWSLQYMVLTMHGPYNAWSLRCMVLTMHGPYNALSLQCTVLTVHGPYNARSLQCMVRTMHGPYSAWSLKIATSSINPFSTELFHKWEEGLPMRGCLSNERSLQWMVSEVTGPSH